MNKYHFVRFDKSQRSSFRYWYYHWKAFNLVAFFLGAWKFKYLFHDIEKPWLKLFLPYKDVQTFHRKHSNHHLKTIGNSVDKSYEYDWEAMMIDWECSGYTKTSAIYNAVQELEQVLLKFSDIEDRKYIVKHAVPALLKLGLTTPEIVLDARIKNGLYAN